jgi:hypothetical protein
VTRRYSARRLPAATSAAYVLLLVLAIRLGWLFARYQSGNPTVHRYHVESGALLLVAAGLLFRLSRRASAPAASPTAALHARIAWPAFVALALALYWPSLSVGFLSDDYALVERASHWIVLWKNVEFIRPVPLLVWSVLLHLGAGAAVLHLLNVVLHGTNAYLVSRVVGGWLNSRTGGALAGVAFLTFPLAPEAVVWCSGIFDVMATTLMLTCVLTAAAYAAPIGPATRVRFFVLALAAMASKETAVMTPLLVLADAWIRGQVPRRLLRDAAVLLVIAAVSVAIRVLARTGASDVPVNAFVLRRGVFQAFGALALPYHSDLAHLTLISIVTGLVLIALATWFFLRRGPARPFAGSLAWIALSIVPVLPILVVDGHLQASRYLYLATVAWSAILVTVTLELGATGRGWRLVSSAILGALLTTATYSTRIHQRHWRDAAALRDAVERAVGGAPAFSTCPHLTLGGLPDQVRGAYVFRNGGGEAFARDLGLSATAGAGTGPCAFRWDAAAGNFQPADR